MQYNYTMRTKCAVCGNRGIPRKEVNLTVCQSCGYTWQTELVNIFEYDSDYITRAYSNAPVIEMSWLRLGLLITTLGKTDGTILDIGYGDGSFARAAQTSGFTVYGYDVNPTEYGISRIHSLKHAFDNKLDCVTLFDSYEHMLNIEDIFSLNTEYFVLTVPYFDRFYNDGGTIEDISNWKHYKPDEHLHYFTGRSLGILFSRHGYEHVRALPLEDAIRKDVNKPNTMTYVFKEL